MRKRNLVLSGVMQKQSRINRLSMDLKVRTDLSALAREKIEEQIDMLRRQLVQR